ncbi:M16 family metallopeptidase [Aerobium aerolatum]|uniref:Zinc protease n=1 Tax=Aquamicrobium aerolatum DSM 21857 TaxID=1121003 RepID=A0A1I3HGV5_9HYPH|nr:pitrilysin family protein [Aquamicrobium aerolatum]SFI34985.1 zinc protease [Aquamicrobium aerolatum DSM 21857]
MKLIPDCSLALRSAALAAFLVVPVTAASALEAGNVSHFTLDNGLEVVVVPDRRAPVVTHMLWYKVGSADEAPGKSGIAHFFEHLMFKGTSTHGPGEFSGYISKVGGRENAFTSYDYTAYFQQVAPTELKTMMSFEADRMRNLVLTDDVIGPERDVIIEERNSRVESSPQALHGEEVSATLYQNHPYRIPVIGWMQEIEQLNRADAVDFYQQFYAPNNAVLVVTGDVDEATVRTLAEETYGAVERGPDLPPRVRPVEPEQNTRRIVTMNDARVGVPSYSKRWVVPSYTTAKDGEAEALEILGEVLGGGMRSRIYQEVVVKNGLASGAGAYYQGTALDDTTFAIYGSPRGDATIEDVEKAIDAEVAKILKDGITEDELAKAKKRAVRSMIFARDDQSGMARIYGATLTTGGTVEEIAAYPERINAVTADQVKAVAVRYLDARRSVTGYLLPVEDDRS